MCIYHVHVADLKSIHLLNMYIYMSNLLNLIQYMGEFTNHDFQKYRVFPY